MISQYLSIKGQYPDAVLFYRMGDFYEMFFEDAERAAGILDITLTSRNKNVDKPIPMCGVPHHARNAYLSKLIRQGCKVAICEQIEEPGQIWHIGAGAFRVGSAFLRRTKVVERARQPMDALMRATGETANLGVESADEVLFLSQVETHEAIRAFFPPGTKAPMHVSGIGKALLAWYPAPRVEALIALRGLVRFTPLSITSPAQLGADLARTRARGFAIDDQERAEGMRCVAAPIFNAYAEPVAGISVSGPAFRVGLDAAARLGADVRAAADAVTLAIGGKAPQD
jgi:IclR family acetate operon transcriptional repressor